MRFSSWAGLARELTGGTEGATWYASTISPGKKINESADGEVLNHRPVAVETCSKTALYSMTSSSSISHRCTEYARVMISTRTLIFSIPGTRSRAISTRFPVRPSTRKRIPVTLALGRASLAAKPKPTGSVLTPTIGMLVVACFAARTPE
jgi:hypothetical protein